MIFSQRILELLLTENAAIPVTIGIRTEVLERGPPFFDCTERGRLTKRASDDQRDLDTLFGDSHEPH